MAGIALDRRQIPKRGSCAIGLSLSTLSVFVLELHFAQWHYGMITHRAKLRVAIRISRRSFRALTNPPLRQAPLLRVSYHGPLLTLVIYAQGEREASGACEMDESTMPSA